MKSDSFDFSGSYWDAAANEPRASLWREYSDSLNSALLSEWIADRKPRRVLKTDAYDEAVAAGTAADNQSAGKRLFRASLEVFRKGLVPVGLVRPLAVRYFEGRLSPNK